MNKAIILISVLVAGFALAFAQDQAAKKTALLETKIVLTSHDPIAVQEEIPPFIQLAILLDTSGSMSGLINQAKTQLWKIVNEFATMKQAGRTPELQVALYEYGNDGLPADENYLRMILPLTTDLDKVSAELFALTTNGGQEYCGTVIQEAIMNLGWSKRSSDMKTIFIAGNEPFSQGKIDFRAACRAAVANGVAVNTIYCGNHADGVNTHWKEGADLAEGSYMNIDHNQVVTHIAAPQDQEIAKLGQALNDTYLAFGREGAAGVQNQADQDRNAEEAGEGTAVLRAVAKVSVHYKNSTWDLVDAVEKDALDLKKVDKEELPAVMQDMPLKEQQKFLKKKAEKRKKIQEKISKLDAERKKYVGKKRAEQATSEEETFDSAVIESIRRLAKEKKFDGEEK